MERFAEIVRADVDDLTVTNDTVADFIAAHGEPTETNSHAGLTVYEWCGLRNRSVFDLTRGNLYVADLGDKRVAHIERNFWKSCKAS